MKKNVKKFEWKTNLSKHPKWFVTYDLWEISDFFLFFSVLHYFKLAYSSVFISILHICTAVHCIVFSVLYRCNISSSRTFLHLINCWNSHKFLSFWYSAHSKLSAKTEFASFFFVVAAFDNTLISFFCIYLSFRLHVVWYALSFCVLFQVWSVAILASNNIIIILHYI